MSGCSDGSPGERDDGPTETTVAVDDTEGDGAPAAACTGQLSMDGGGTDGHVDR